MSANIKIEPWHRRHALQIACQLPENQGDALAVLEAAQVLVTTFMQSGAPEPAKAPVVALVRPRPDLSA